MLSYHHNKLLIFSSISTLLLVIFMATIHYQNGLIKKLKHNNISSKKSTKTTTPSEDKSKIQYIANQYYENGTLYKIVENPDRTIHLVKSNLETPQPETLITGLETILNPKSKNFYYHEPSHTLFLSTNTLGDTYKGLNQIYKIPIKGTNINLEETEPLYNFPSSVYGGYRIIGSIPESDMLIYRAASADACGWAGTIYRQTQNSPLEEIRSYTGGCFAMKGDLTFIGTYDNNLLFYTHKNRPDQNYNISIENFISINPVTQEEKILVTYKPEFEKLRSTSNISGAISNTSEIDTLKPNEIFLYGLEKTYILNIQTQEITLKN